MKLCKLLTHPAEFSEDELVLNAKGFPHIKIGDVVEIYHAEDEYSRLLLDVKHFSDDFQPKDRVSVAQCITSSFNLRPYQDVFINVVSARDVSLDLLELTFKDQYFSRADMWRLRSSLVNSCVYLSKKIEFVSMRAQAHVLWVKGQQVRSGYITANTRVTYRSTTAQVNIFIQMSSEMWEFDNYGDLYFEKACNGYLVDLFRQWKEKLCNHDVTITLFSRTFYEAKSFDDFPVHMRECITQDYLGRFYEDFYRVVVQNERYDDWTNTITNLKRLFSEYVQRVLHYHRRETGGGLPCPPTRNSAAPQGNFLDVLNMALNVFEKSYLDRNFERTGKLSIVITPGPGVFEVDRELCNITKQRTIDCGNSLDLVCMGEQPLHVVPLFKFHNKNPSNTLDVGDDYNIPHWINHSFYTSRSQAEQRHHFVPRVKWPQVTSPLCCERECVDTTKINKTDQSRDIPLTEDVPFLGYDEYDAQVFKVPTSGKFLKNHDRSAPHKSCSLLSCQRSLPRLASATSRDSLDSAASRSSCSVAVHRRHSADYVTGGPAPNAHNENGNFNIKRPIIGSAGSPVGHQSNHSLHNYLPNRALINPFAPKRLHLKVTSNRRRWTHAFPPDLQGMSVQPHHKQQSFLSPADTQVDYSPPTREVVHAAKQAVEMRKHRTQRLSDGSDGQESSRARSVTHSGTECSSVDSLREFVTVRQLSKVASSGALSLSTVDSHCSLSNMAAASAGDKEGSSADSADRHRSSSVGLYSRSASYHRDLDPLGTQLAGHTWLWGVTGEQEWTIELKTGMDWASMTMPASLPMTTDYFPEKRSLEFDYVISDYSVVPESVHTCQSKSHHTGAVSSKQVTTIQVYKEMIACRIAKGFQIVLAPPKAVSHAPVPCHQRSSAYIPGSTGSLLRTLATRTEAPEDITLSIGRIFHKLSLSGETVTITRYWPRHPFVQKTHRYAYRFQVPDSDSYDVSWTEFTNEKLENYNWNYLDLYINTRGEDEFGLIESLKHWRARFFLLPCNSPASKKIMEGATRCDIYGERTVAEQQQLMEGFFRFIEHLNRIKRTHLMRSRKTESQLRRPSYPQQMLSPVERDRSAPSDVVTASQARSVFRLTDFDSPSATLLSTPGVTTTEQRIGGPGDLLLGSGKLAENNIRGLSESLNSTSSSERIVAAMLDSNGGLNIIRGQQQSPAISSACFVSAEAVAWLQKNLCDVSTVSHAVNIMQRLIDKELLCHASGNKKQRFVYGYYIYCFPDESTHPLQPNATWHYDWFEVAFMVGDSGTVSPGPDEADSETLACSLPSSACWRPEQGLAGDKTKEAASSLDVGGGKSNSLDMLSLPYYWENFASARHKVVNVNIDVNHKSEREEWGTVRYHSAYSPLAAFELELHWMVATGNILEELVQAWARKAGACNFHVLPVPGDPFALPFTPDSDPLRGPIFVPLNLDCLAEEGTELFHDLEAGVRENKLHSLKEYILKRFGFLPDRSELPRQQPPEPEHFPQYVHCSGGMFVMIPSARARYSSGGGAGGGGGGGAYRKLTGSSHTDYIARQRSNRYAVGFLWTWNFMLTRRRRSQYTGDEHFQDRVLADFRRFCGNSERRLWAAYQTWLTATG